MLDCLYYIPSTISDFASNYLNYFRMEPSSDISIESVEEDIKKSSLNRVRKRKKQLYADLKKQMEFYLSDANLRKDRYFGNLMQTSQCKLYFQISQFIYIY